MLEALGYLAAALLQGFINFLLQLIVQHNINPEALECSQDALSLRSLKARQKLALVDILIESKAIDRSALRCGISSESKPLYLR